MAEDDSVLDGGDDVEDSDEIEDQLSAEAQQYIPYVVVALYDFIVFSWSVKIKLTHPKHNLLNPVVFVNLLT